MTTWRIANMLWRIGELLDFDRQLAWTLDAGFEGVGFHASGGVPGQWRGIDPARCDANERRRLRQEIARFALVEIHAPFRIELDAGNLARSRAELAPVLELAGDLGAGVVTVHARIPSALTASESADWRAAMQVLSAEAARRGLTVGLETVEGFDAVKGWGLANIGVTLDVGHMHIQEAGRAELTRRGGLAGVVRHLGPALVHLHVHDVVAGVDHCEVGAGMVDFGTLLAALPDIGYTGGLCLEFNPDRVTPEGIRRSREHLRSLLGHR